MRELFNRLRWEGGEAGQGVVLVVRNRQGGQENLQEHSFSEVTEISPRGVTLRDATFVPFHRMVTVCREGCRLWSRETDG